MLAKGREALAREGMQGVALTFENAVVSEVALAKAAQHSELLDIELGRHVLQPSQSYRVGSELFCR